VTPDRGGLEAANATFYEAFEALDLDRMERVWHHGEDVYCIHPGGEMIDGWDRVRRSWAAIFASTPYMQFIVTDVTVRVVDRTGCVTCLENILTGGSDPADLGGGLAVATNLFAWHDGRWAMMAHHASPVLRRTG
jgi:ketosteroid isomerase-like protein